MIKSLLNLLKPYRVQVLGNACDGVTHRAWTYSDALSWASCYGTATALEVHIRTRSGKLLGIVW